MKGINNKYLTAAALTGIILFSACEYGDGTGSKPPVATFLGVDTAGQAKFTVHGYGSFERGIVYRQSPNVTLENGTALTFNYGVYEVKFQTTPNAVYYWRPYFKDKLGGVLYGQEDSFTAEADSI